MTHVVDANVQKLVRHDRIVRFRHNRIANDRDFRFFSRVETLRRKLEDEKSRLSVSEATIQMNRSFLDELRTSFRQSCAKIGRQGSTKAIDAAAALGPESPEDDIAELLENCSERVTVLVARCRDHDRTRTTKMYEEMKASSLTYTLAF